MFVDGFALHAEEDAAIGEGVGQASNGSDNLWAPAGKASQAIAGTLGVGTGTGLGKVVCDTQDVGGVASVACIEDTAQLIVGLEEGVGFVDEQSWAEFLDEAEEGRRANIGGRDRAMDEFAEDAQEGGFSAALFGGLDGEV